MILGSSTCIEDEHSKFFGVRIIERVGFLSELGLADEEFDLMGFVDSLGEELGFGIHYQWGQYVWNWVCVEDLGAGDAGEISGIEFPDGSSK